MSHNNHTVSSISSKNQSFIGVDLGATNVRVARIYDDEIIALENEPIVESKSDSDLLRQIQRLITAVNTEEVASIGIGVPSVVDVEEGIVYDVQNISGWDKVPVKQIFEEQFHKPVFVNNDANCFVLGEKYFGKGRGVDSIVGLTLGSGFGSGLVLNGQLYWGQNCGAGEVGMLPYHNSIFEHYCSGMFFEREYGITGKEAFQQVKNNSEEAIEMYKAFGTHLGNGIKAVLYAYDPQIVVLGGTIRHAFPYFKEQMYSALDDFAFSRSAKNLQIEVSELEHSALLGAAVLALDQQR